MGFLRKLLSYKSVCIQCHNDPDPDTLASAYGVYCYLQANGVDSTIIYGGSGEIKKGGTRLLVKECGIPVTYVHSLPPADLLLLVDCQSGSGNVEGFASEKTAIIDHHIRVVEERAEYLIKSNYQSCSTIIYELLTEEGFPVLENQKLVVALLYGLYIDTSCFADLFQEQDIAMRKALFDNQPLFEKLTKSCMSVAELMVATDAMYNHYFDVEHKFAIVEALSCDQAVLGIIGDFMIQVDAVLISLAYTRSGGGYQISIRTCDERFPANEVAAFVCEGIGGGGGHSRKAGGRILIGKMQEKYGDMSIFDVVDMRLCRYCESIGKNTEKEELQ